MKISADWLSDFVDLSGLSPEEIAEQLTVRTAEVEGFEVIDRAVEGKLVGEIVAAEAFSVGERVRYACTVDVGARRYATVCGAPNVRVGMKAVFAPPGTRLQNGDTVAVATVHGRQSEGVLCAPGELGLGTTKEGLLEVPPAVAAGTALSSLIAARDVVIEIDNKSLTHRPDLWGHYGFARELSAIFERPLRPFVTDPLPTSADLPVVPVQVEDATDCPLYSALGFRVAENPVSPLHVQARLLTLGSTPINTLVDVTNYVQFELGQPTHAFDARCLTDVRVARAGALRSFTTLDGKQWALQPDDLLIWNGAEPVALAGIMGGLDSRILPDTRALVLESATFRASRVRVTSVRLGLRTDSSLRFEKKPPPLYAKLAAGRILTHLREAGVQPVATTRYSFVGDFRDAPRTITLAPGWMQKRAGAPLPDTTITGILTALGFGCDPTDDGGFTVTVPAFRSVADISIPEDISEEVMRLYGYDNLPPTLPAGPLRPVPPHAETRGHHRARRVLSEAHRFVEVQTYGWHADDWLAEIGYTPEQPLTLKNPIAPTRRQLRDTLLPNLLAAAQQNRNVAEGFRLYELGRTFHFAPGDARRVEANELAGLIVDQSGASPEGSLRAARAAIEDLTRSAGLGLPEFSPAESGPPWQRKGRALVVTVGGQPFGHLGVLPADLTGRILNAGHLVWFALSTRPLEGEVYPTPRYVAPPILPGSWQDFTFTWPVNPGFAGLSATLDSFSHPMVEAREFVTVYQPKNSVTANYSFRFLLRVPDRTPTQADLDGFREAFLTFVAANELKLA